MGRNLAVPALAAALMALTAGASHAAELISNGGFENGVYTDAGGNTNVPVDWTPASSFDYGGGDVNAVTQGNGHSGMYALTFGNYDAQPASSISQAFNDVVGASYTGSLWVYADSGGDPNALFTAQIDGTDVVSTGDSAVTSYTQEMFSFTGTGHDTLTLNASTNPGEWHVDDVSVAGLAAPPVSAAPEPSIWALMVAGVGGAGLMLRRARKSVGHGIRGAFAA